MYDHNTCIGKEVIEFIKPYCFSISGVIKLDKEITSKDIEDGIKKMIGGNVTFKEESSKSDQDNYITINGYFLEIDEKHTNKTFVVVGVQKLDKITSKINNEQTTFVESDILNSID